MRGIIRIRCLRIRVIGAVGVKLGRVSNRGPADSENRVAHAGSERKTSEMKKGGRNGENPQDFCLFFHKKVALQKGRMYNKKI